MRKFLSFARRLSMAMVGILSGWIFLNILFFSFTLMLIQIISSRGNDLYPFAWNGAIAFVWQNGFLFLVLIVIGNWLAKRIKKLVAKCFLHYLVVEEKEMLRYMVHHAKMFRVPLPYQSEHVQVLVREGLIKRGSGMNYPGSDVHPQPHTYYSLPSWLFEYLRRKPQLLRIKN
ncbi:MAG: hypothetical protein O3B43_04425 [Chloroflexi bacterium]|nr:hypothetical protein [Chloroflexota bacterium]